MGVELVYNRLQVPVGSLDVFNPIMSELNPILMCLNPIVIMTLYVMMMSIVLSQGLRWISVCPSMAIVTTSHPDKLAYFMIK